MEFRKKIEMKLLEKRNNLIMKIIDDRQQNPNSKYNDERLNRMIVRRYKRLLKDLEIELWFRNSLLTDFIKFESIEWSELSKDEPTLYQQYLVEEIEALIDINDYC